ncbi:MAG TPA: flagellar hook capping FlgD N-terminal domain-containing protein [Steroidobacteraceae bacterium]|nr:flagellar hook capping FlgD N-terminal domain-containing protein [Steroidobacteraceae bacterium]
MSSSAVGSTTATNPLAAINGSGASSANGSSNASSATSGVGGLTMNDFLTLMTAQLKNQDPLNPTDSNQFLAQLSELSTVEGISQLNTSVTTLSDSMLSSQALSSAALVGQGVLAPASSAAYISGQSLGGAVQVPTGATGVVLTISNAAGAVVDQLSISPSAGLQSFTWNGTTSNGQAAPSGTYSIAANALVGGTTEAASTYVTGTVSSVTLGTTGQSPTLNTPQLGPVALSSVQQID